MKDDVMSENYNPSDEIYGDYDYRKVSVKNDPIYILKNELKRLHHRCVVKKDYCLETPDFLYRTKKVAIYVLSDFWHGYDISDIRHQTNMRNDFWISKIEENIEKYNQIREDKTKQGYKVLFIFKSEIFDNLEKCSSEIALVLNE